MYQTDLIRDRPILDAIILYLTLKNETDRIISINVNEIVRSVTIRLLDDPATGTFPSGRLVNRTFTLIDRDLVYNTEVADRLFDAGEQHQTLNQVYDLEPGKIFFLKTNLLFFLTFFWDRNLANHGITGITVDFTLADLGVTVSESVYFSFFSDQDRSNQTLPYYYKLNVDRFPLGEHQIRVNRLDDGTVEDPVEQKIYLWKRAPLTEKIRYPDYPYLIDGPYIFITVDHKESSTEVIPILNYEIDSEILVYSYRQISVKTVSLLE